MPQKSYCVECNRLNKAESALRTAALPCTRCGGTRARNQTLCQPCYQVRNRKSHDNLADMPCSRCGEGRRESNSSWCVPCNRAALTALRERYGYYGKDREKGRATARRANHRRRAAQRSVVEIRVDPWPDTCGRCQCPIDPSERHAKWSPNPKAESVGHEPPLAWANRNGLIFVDVRPEHWRCNTWRGDEPDHLRPPIPIEFHIEHGCRHAS